ncbi:MAG: LPS export ABC transporter permease LptG [Gammaproteobacteria bacterium]|nr:LPS export ABC transporter permease LptG [Gammaproteobacteria bacterium]MAY03509.1 LPS export ABC transporter permease LptG [Gammaproteobacteria bacterium]|tara:strand:- start:178631 stop:179701 length:1071 start_codon:yes stop_codon:yes gene_type:complete
MRKLDLYISKTILLAMLLVLLVLAGLDFLFTLFDEVAGVNERYTMKDALTYVLLTFPRHIYDLLPITALMGSLIGLGVLASSNELVVMQAAGIKAGRVVWSVMKPALLVMLAGILLGEYLAPTLELRAEVNKSIANSDQIGLSTSGSWQRDGDDFVHFDAIEPQGVLHGVSIYRFNDAQEMTANITAERGRYENRNWVLENVRQTFFSQADGGIESQSQEFEELVWQTDLSPDVLQLMIMDSDKLTITALYGYAQRFISQGQDASAYLLAFWNKLLQPLATAALVLVAISFIFGPLREATMGARVFTGISFGLGFIILQRVFNTVGAVYQFNPLLAALLPIILTALIGILLLRKAA